MHQTTLDEQIDRAAQIERLDRSLARQRATGLDQRIPDEYERYCGILEHLRQGGAYAVRRVGPDTIDMSKGTTGSPTVDGMIRDIAQGFAGISRSQSIAPRRTRR